MAKSAPKKRVTFTLNPELIERLRAVSDETDIPQARLVEKAITHILERYEKKEQQD